METKDLIQMSIRACRMNNEGRRVVLYLDRSMTIGDTEGSRAFLPVLDVEGQSGYSTFLESYQERFAGYFGGDYAEANRLVEQINQENDIDPDEALEIVAGSMAGEGPRYIVYSYGESSFDQEKVGTTDDRQDAEEWARIAVREHGRRAGQVMLYDDGRVVSWWDADEVARWR